VVEGPAGIGKSRLLAKGLRLRVAAPGAGNIRARASVRHRRVASGVRFKAKAGPTTTKTLEVALGR
jgi:hypothetical protein